MEKEDQEEHPNDASTHSSQRNSKLAILTSKFRSHVKKAEAKDLPDSMRWKGWQMLSNTSKKSNVSALRSFLREHLFQFLGTFSLIICAILFTLQAYLAFRSFQMMNQLQPKPQIPEILYRIYFEGNDWAFKNLDRVELRANTSIFIH